MIWIILIGQWSNIHIAQILILIQIQILIPEVSMKLFSKII